MKVHIIGVKEAVQMLDVKNKEILQKVNSAINSAALDVEREVKISIARGTNAPIAFDTGRFCRSVNVVPGIMKASIETNVEYAKFIEYGTKKYPYPRPHFKNTAAREREKVINKVRQAVR